MSDNVLRFEATAGTAIAAADNITTLEDLPASPGIQNRGWLPRLFEVRRQVHSLQLRC